jgi:antagonist of KipI
VRAGGIAVKSFLGSASTHLLSGLGGHEGRALRKGDVLKTGAASDAFRKRKVAEKALKTFSPRRVLRVTPGPQSEWFPEAAQKLFYASTYRVAEESNRMGLRLEGAAITAGAHGKADADARGSALGDAHGNAFGDAHGNALGEMISEGVSLGAVQIAAGGLPIILFVEQQTTGGYAKIANVISGDLHSLGQLRPRDEIRFERVDFETARALLMELEESLAAEEWIV